MCIGFVKLLIARRLLRDTEHERQRVSLNQLDPGGEQGLARRQPEPAGLERYSHSLAFTAEIRKEKLLFHLILNAYWEPLEFELPPRTKGDGNPWRRWIDTALDSPHDIVPWQTAAPVSGHTYRAEARSVVVLFAGLG